MSHLTLLFLLFLTVLLISFTVPASSLDVSVSVSVHSRSHRARYMDRAMASSRSQADLNEAESEMSEGAELDEATGNEPKVSMGQRVASVAADALPFVGLAKSAQELATGRDLITGEKVPAWQAGLGMALGVIPGGKLVGTLAGKAMANFAAGGLKTAARTAPTMVAKETANFVTQGATQLVANPRGVAGSIVRDQAAGLSGKSLGVTAGKEGATFSLSYQLCVRKARRTWSNPTLLQKALDDCLKKNPPTPEKRPATTTTNRSTRTTRNTPSNLPTRTAPTRTAPTRTTPTRTTPTRTAPTRTTPTRTTPTRTTPTRTAPTRT